MGTVTPLGNDVAHDLGGPRRRPVGRRARSTSFDPSRLTVQIAGRDQGLRPVATSSTARSMRRTDRYIQFALVCARQALDHAGLPAASTTRWRRGPGVIIGSGLGGVSTLFDNVLRRWPSAARTGSRRSSSRWASPTSAPGQVAIASGAIGPNFATVSACATGGHALGEAWETIRRGDADMMIAGGVEAGIHEATSAASPSMKALSTRNDDPGGGVAAVRPGPRRLRDGRGRRRARSSRRSSTPRRAARRRSPSSSATARPPTRRTSRCRRRAASARSGRPGGRSRRRASSPPRSTT